MRIVFDNFEPLLVNNFIDQHIPTPVSEPSVGRVLANLESLLDSLGSAEIAQHHYAQLN